MIGLSMVNRLSKSRYDKPCGCYVDGVSFRRSTTMMKRILRSGKGSRSSADGSERLLGRDVAGTRHHHLRFRALIVARFRPNAEALGAMLNRLVHRQVLQVLLLVRDDDIDVVGALQAVIGH